MCRELWAWQHTELFRVWNEMWRKWLQDFRFEIGKQKSAKDVLVTKHAHVAKDTHCFLSFDEMQLKERWCYDKVRNTAPDLLKKLLQIKKKLLRIYIKKTTDLLKKKKKSGFNKKKQHRNKRKKQTTEKKKKKTKK